MYTKCSVRVFISLVVLNDCEVLLTLGAEIEASVVVNHLNHAIVQRPEL